MKDTIIKYTKYFIIFVFIVAFFYLAYNYSFNKIGNRLLKKKTFLGGSYNSFITNLDLPHSKIATRFTYSFWLYLNNNSENQNWNSSFDSDKIIIHREDSSPKITYNPKFNLMKIFINYKNEEQNNVDFVLETHELKVQKWQHIVVILDNRTLKLYIDKKLNRTGFLPNTPFLFSKNLQIGEQNNNINGSIFNLKYYNYVLSKKQIKHEYKKDKYKIL